MNNTDEIIDILATSSTPVKSLDALIKFKIRKVELWWFVLCMIISVACGVTLITQRPNRRDKLRYAEPIVDSMKVRYQQEFDRLCDSVEKANTFNYLKTAK